MALKSATPASAWHDGDRGSSATPDQIVIGQRHPPPPQTVHDTLGPVKAEARLGHAHETLTGRQVFLQTKRCEFAAARSTRSLAGALFQKTARDGYQRDTAGCGGTAPTTPEQARRARDR